MRLVRVAVMHFVRATRYRHLNAVLETTVETEGTGPS
jgi:hypothetical protein